MNYIIGYGVSARAFPVPRATEETLPAQALPEATEQAPPSTPPQPTVQEILDRDFQTAVLVPRGLLGTRALGSLPSSVFASVAADLSWVLRLVFWGVGNSERGENGGEVR